MSDLTGWCEQGQHQKCDGTKHGGTGYHWWCVCLCHPESPSINGPGGADRAKALEVWHAARAALATTVTPPEKSSDG